jgi:hypothetical protein
MLVSDLLQEIPPDTHRVVAQTCDAWSRRIRAQLTTSLLRWGLQHRSKQLSRSATISNDWARIGHPEDAVLPPVLTGREIPAGLERAARLAVYGPASERLAESARRLQPLFAERNGTRWTDTRIHPAMARGTLESAAALGDDLQRLATPPMASGEPFDLVRYLLAVNEDVLGLYAYPTHERHDRLDSSLQGSVVVYWGAVGLVAAAMGVSVQAMSVVVLAHELAHGHTHLGHDRDGHRWASEDFAATEPALTEALAQYYTHLVCEQLDGAVPGLFDAYWSLLPRQPEIYQLHLPLILHASPERVAARMARLRRSRASYSQLLDELRIADRLGGVPREWRDAVASRRDAQTDHLFGSE